MKNLIFIVTCFACLTACEKTKEDSSFSADFIGTWKLSSYKCSGTSISIEGADDYITIDSSGGTEVINAPLCQARLTGFSISGGDSVTFSGGSASCNLVGCVTNVKATAAGVSGYDHSSCVEGQNTSSSSGWSVQNGVLVMDSGDNCYSFYTKTTETVPSAQCLTATDPVGASSVMGITSNGTDKGAMQFQTATPQSLRGLRLAMDTSYVNSVQIFLYEGGASPEAGTLKATATLSEALGEHGGSTYSFEFGSPVALSTMTDYYVVIKASGTSTLNIFGNTGNAIPSGAMWTYNGSTWSADTNTDLAIGFVYDSTNCH